METQLKILKFKGYEIYHIADFIQAYNAEKQGHFFSKNTMSFFKSKIVEWSRISVDKENGQPILYFITREKKCFNDETKTHSVRKGYVTEDGKLSIDTVNFDVGTLDRAKKIIEGLLC